jgi:prephenate dehydrogenase
MKTIQMNKPLVAGYKGEIGSFILNGLLRVMPKALDIWCVDVNETETEVIERIKISDVIFLCVPIAKTTEWLLNFKPLLSDKIIIEQTSLKDWILDESLKGIDIRSMHILFRPSQTPNKCDRKVALFKDQFDSPIAEKISEITNSDIVWFLNAEEHDKVMAIQQALIHRVLLVLGDTLKNCNGSTYVSQKVLELCDRIKKGNLNLYKAIQKNKHLDVQLNNFVANFENFKIEDFWEK